MPKPRSTEKKLLDVSQQLFRLGESVKVEHICAIAKTKTGIVIVHNLEAKDSELKKLFEAGARQMEGSCW